MKIYRLLSSLQNGLTKRSSSYTIWFQMRCWMTSCLNHDYLILIFIHFSIFNLWISIVYYRLCRDSVYLAANYIATIDSSGDHWSVYTRSQWWKRNDKPEIAVSHRQNPPTSTSKRRKILVVHYIWSNNSHVLVYKGLLWIMCFDFIKKIYKHGHILYCQYILFSFNTYFLGFHGIQ